METIKLRHELKYRINHMDYIEIASKLKTFMDWDENSDVYGTYSVRSLYFDNYQDKVLNEKLNGYPFREKFRIRLYNGDTSFIKLEKKSKMKGLCNKISASITAEQCQRLIDGEIEVLKEIKKPLGLELYSKMNFQQLRPRNVIEYEREAYIYAPGNVRVTFDSKIASTPNIQSFLSEENEKFLPTGETIMEVKYDEFLPQIVRDLVQLQNRQVSAFSKYAISRAII